MTTSGEQEIHWAPSGRAPAKLVAGVNWWLNSDPGQGDDVVALTTSQEDALILAFDNDSNALSVVWVDFEGKVRTLNGTWDTVHEEKEEA